MDKSTEVRRTEDNGVNQVPNSERSDYHVILSEPNRRADEIYNKCKTALEENRQELEEVKEEERSLTHIHVRSLIVVGSLVSVLLLVLFMVMIFALDIPLVYSLSVSLVMLFVALIVFALRINDLQTSLITNLRETRKTFDEKWNKIIIDHRERALKETVEMLTVAKGMQEVEVQREKIKMQERVLATYLTINQRDFVRGPMNKAAEDAMSEE